MYARVLTSGLYGLDGEMTWVEVDVENGMPAFTVVGLANQSIKEAKDRIHSAIINSGYSFPDHRITVNLTPANRKKEGSHYDLAIALGVLLASRQIKEGGLSAAYFGELSLDGRVSPIEGALSMAIDLQQYGDYAAVIPAENMEEVCLVKGLRVAAPRTLREAADLMENGSKEDYITAKGYEAPEKSRFSLDFMDIKGQSFVKRASLVAAAGNHAMLMIGPPGVGKSMVGKRIPGILPPLSYEEQLTVTQIYSVAGELGPGRPMITERPFRSPHHSLSAAAMTGGGSNPKPGEISLSHSGVLFLDELPEFSAHVLDTLRQPLEDGNVTISRVNSKCSYPASFMLIAAMNPCRCGYYGDPVKPCKCTKTDRLRYISKVSGPLLDRIDLHVTMDRIIYGDIVSESQDPGMSSDEMRARVIEAVEMQKKRFRGLSIAFNSKMNSSQIKEFCRLDSECAEIMERAYSAYSLSARSYHRILRVSRTIADLEGCGDIKKEHILEALNYRLPERYFSQEDI